MAKQLQIPEHQNSETTLQNILQIIKTRISDAKVFDALVSKEKSMESQGMVTLQGDLEKDFYLSKFPLGFDTGDHNLNLAATILRLLHIDELRSLQTNINNILANVQSFTANPKTDTSLGRIGK